MALTVKDLIASVEEKSDCYAIRWVDKEKAKGRIEKGGITHLYFDDHDVMIDILLKLGDIYGDDVIVPQAIADMLVGKHPEMLTNMLRPTGKYTRYYYTSLHLENHMRRIIYYRTGKVFLRQEFYDKYKDRIDKKPRYVQNKL